MHRLMTLIPVVPSDAVSHRVPTARRSNRPTSRASRAGTVLGFVALLAVGLGMSNDVEARGPVGAGETATVATTVAASAVGTATERVRDNCTRTRCR